MNKSPAIFQEIESKLAKDHYASTLPVYHPAKGRRKRVSKEPKANYHAEDQHLNGSRNSVGLEKLNASQPDEPLPITPPEIEQPGETGIPRPDEREIDPGRDFPQRDIPHPGEQEMPGDEPGPEVEDPDKLDDIN
ncbi:MAG TPA: hypothetical protein VKX33_04615 [Cyclobacteriaceae bacterium]|nr:hypothetical protein [Cyclobacteriaceae bacterium]